MEITKTSTASKGSRARVVLLVILAVCGLVTIVGLAIGLGVCRNKASTSTEIITTENDLSEQQNNNGSSPNACLKADCAMKAAEITSLGEMLARMDLSADPCDDFYQYACGTFSKPENRNPDQDELRSTDKAQYSTNLLLLAQLTHEGNTYRGKPSTAVTKVKAFYNECVSDTQDDKTGRELLKQLIKKVGLWPISSDSKYGTWSAGAWNMENSIAEAAVLLKETFLNIRQMEDPRNSSNFIFAIHPGEPILGQAELYKDDSTKKTYKEYIIEILTLLYDGPTNKEKTDLMNTLADTIYKFESALATIYKTKTELRESINVNSFVKLGNISKTLTSFIDFVKLLGNIAEESGTTIDKNTEVVAFPDYMNNFTSLVIPTVTNVSMTVSAYLVWTVVHEFVPYAGSSFQKARANFYNKLNKFDFEADVRWRGCLKTTVEALRFAAGAIYTEENVKDDDKQKIDRLLQLIRQEFVDGLPKSEWLQEKTRVKAAQKANAITWQIGFPQYLDTAEKLDSYYNDLYVNAGYFSNIIAQRRFKASQIFSKYGKPVDKKMQWNSMPTDINAEYMPSTNQIFVLAGYMQKPMFDRSFPTSMIYGAMGSVAGHELIHGFDTNGKNYNAEGNIENWWDSESSAEYDKKASCFIKQYSEENFHGFPVNGKLTITENIADNGGIRLAYNAYLKDVGSQANKVDQLLPGLNMTGKKEFFLAYSQRRCSSYARSAAEEVVKDVHSPGPQRVNVVLRNTPQFAEAFNCPDGSKMNPSDQCSLW